MSALTHSKSLDSGTNTDLIIVSQSSEITPRIRPQILNLTTVDKITGDTLTSELGTFNATTEVRRETPQPLV